MTRLWGVTIPIAGHAFKEVEAETEEEAIEKAMMEVELSDISEWDAMREISRGNVLYFPSPWSAEAEDMGESE